MTFPPGSARLTQNGIAGTRTKAEIRREIADRINAASRRAGLQLHGAQVRILMKALIAAEDAPTEEEIYSRLMAAPWSRKTTAQSWRLGETGWRLRS